MLFISAVGLLVMHVGVTADPDPSQRYTFAEMEVPELKVAVFPQQSPGDSGNLVSLIQSIEAKARVQFPATALHFPILAVWPLQTDRGGT
jgi:hypothetical protein